MVIQLSISQIDGGKEGSTVFLRLRADFEGRKLGPHRALDRPGGRLASQC